MTAPLSLGWLVLSDRGLLDPAQSATVLHTGLFVMEFTLPLQGSGVLVNHQSTTGPARTLAVFADPASGLVLLHRQGDAVCRHVLPGPLPESRCTARLSFGFDAPARSWTLNLETLDTDTPVRQGARGHSLLPIRLADMQALCADQPSGGALLWYGLTAGTALPRAAPWIGMRTPVETSLGAVAAGNLRPGDMILTADHGPLPLLSTTSHALPARGSFAPVLLRAPFFGLTQDLLVSADQMIAVTGPETEYLFGDESVLMAAGSLVDGRTALLDQRRGIVGSVALDLGRPALIEANGCLLATGQDQGQQLPLRGLQHYEVLTLMSLLGRTPRRAA